MIGSLIGAGVAMLLAPQSGEKTRRQIAKYGKKAGFRVRSLAGNVAESLDDVLGDVREFGEARLEQGLELTAKARKEAIDAFDAGKKFLEKEKDKLG